VLDCPYRIFPLSSAEQIAAQLHGLSTVLLCAGPFSHTAERMIEACLQARVNYLDITGELDVIEFAARQHHRAITAGISIISSVGFDVVPSDCLSAQLAAALPTAVELQLAFTAGSPISPGTAQTMLTRLGDGGRVRKDGRIVRVPVAWKTAEIPFPSGIRRAVTLPWGDVSTAFHTTGIPNIRVYAAMRARQIHLLRCGSWLLPMSRFSLIQWIGRQWIKRYVRGPSESEQASGRAEFWGRATDNEGRIAEATLITPEGYSLTAQTALEAVRKTVAGDVGVGFWTPAKAFGRAFIDQFNGVAFAWRTVPT
jgi:short subunit dehydrogenase-like uncharacterized protein